MFTDDTVNIKFGLENCILLCLYYNSRIEVNIEMLYYIEFLNSTYAS